MLSLHAFPESVFKAYDIRGTCPDQLNEKFAYALGRVLGRQAKENELSSIVVGYDNRQSSPTLARGLCAGICDEGINVCYLGEVPTPLVYYVTYREDKGACVAITGSHNPTEYNGFKMMMDRHTLSGDEIYALRTMMMGVESQEKAAVQGEIQPYDVIPQYIEEVSRIVKLARPLRIAIDCGNAVCSHVAPRLFKALGCEVTELFCTSDGTFPNHHPDPADPKNLQVLIETVQEQGLDVGLAFDGDGDRLGVVTPSGEIIWPDRQLILFAQDILKRAPGSQIIYDVKCSRHVHLAVQEAGGQAHMGRTGHSFIKQKLWEIGAALAGEMSGHLFFKDRWYGFDDGLYAGSRLLEIVSQSDNPGQMLDSLPKDVSTPEIKLAMQEGEPHKLIERLQENLHLFNRSLKIETLDGVRAEYSDGFGLARASNTTPVVVLRFEAENQQALKRIQEDFKKALTTVWDNLNIPF